MSEILKNVVKTQCRYGLMTVFENDMAVGNSLRKYGEWFENEVNLLLDIITAGAIVLDIGAYIGTHTLAFSKKVGEKGQVISFEPRPEFFALLKQNVADNELKNVELHCAAVSNTSGSIEINAIDISKPLNFGGTWHTHPGSSDNKEKYQVPVMVVDELGLNKCDLIKIDTEGMDPVVLQGMRNTLVTLRPVVYAEFVSVETGYQMLNYVHPLNYKAFVHIPKYYNPANFKSNKENIYGMDRESSLVLVPGEKLIEFNDIRLRLGADLLPASKADDFVIALLKVSSYKSILADTEAGRVTGVEYFALEHEIAQNGLNTRGSHSWKPAALLRKALKPIPRLKNYIIRP